MGRKKNVKNKTNSKPNNINKSKKLKTAPKVFSSKKFSRLLGMKDVLASDYKFLNPIIKKIEETALCYSFGKIETPILEDYSFYKKILDKNKIKSLFLVDQSSVEKMALRPDLVHGMVRALVEHGNLNNLVGPLKFFSVGPVFRQEKVKGGVYRQFGQFNFSIINDPKPISDAFLIFLVFNIFKELQIDVQVQINSMGDFDCQKEFLHKFSKFLKERGRRSKLCNECKKNIFKSPSSLLECQEEECLKVRAEMPQIVDFLSEESSARFYKTMEFLDEMEINYNFNPYLTRDLNCYNDLIFEIWPIDKNGEANPKLTLGRGGRYDNVFSSLAGREIPLLGFSGGIERTLIKAKENNLFIEDDKDAIFLAQIDVSAKAKSMFLFKELLSKGFNVKQAFHLDGLKDQLEEARNLKAKIVLILGRKELSEETILFRDIESGVQEIIARKDLINRLEKSIACS
ncbi:MAG: ATP phosphoribosyltransferase regulatory subunit [Patescibacteria group bacterium]|jgi:histidyl-tRNA synthetase